MTTQIATKANNLQKSVSKKMAFDTLLEIIESESTPTENQLSQLYKHFLPSTPAKPKTTFDWVTKAIGVKDVRYYLNQTYCDGKNIVATDGRRAHIALNTENMAPGYYDKAGNAVECDGRFPDYQRIIPSESGRKGIILSEIYKTNGVFVSETGAVKIHYYELSFNGSDAVRVQKDYFDAIVSGMNDSLVYLGKPNESILFKQGDRTAVLMPMKK